MTVAPVSTGVIEYCLSNVEDASRRRLAAREDAVEAPCLEHCGICRREPFVIADGEFVRGGEPVAELLAAEGESG